MAVLDVTAPPDRWSIPQAQPDIDRTASIHACSNIIGDVHVGAHALIAPGTSIRADEGGSFHLGAGSTVQDGAIIHGLQQGRVLGEDGQDYAVWIGQNTSITHMVLVHGPAYVGNDCFIGFRSTVFNARIGDGCIIMMHALIQDVEIPPGKFVPSGAIVTRQQQADQLPDVRDIDQRIATYIGRINQTLQAGSVASPVSPAYNTSTRHDMEGTDKVARSSNYGSNQGRLSPEVVEHTRQLLRQGYLIGTEHADARRFRTSSWYSCSPIQASREGEVFSALEACLQEHSGEYVRLFGIDKTAKRRVAELIVQRPGDSTNGKAPAAPSYSSYSPAPKSSNGSAPSPSSDVATQVRSLLAQGYRVAAEYADARRFQTSSWKTCSPIESNREADVMNALCNCMAEHQGEYVRMYGVDTKSKRRVTEVIIQRPGDGSTTGGASTPTPAYSSASASASTSYAAPSGGGRLSNEAVGMVRQLLSQGHRVGAEYADTRRFQTSSWHTCSAAQGTREAEVLRSIEACMQEHGGDYVRIYGIDTKVKRRVSELIVQRP